MSGKRYYYEGYTGLLSALYMHCVHGMHFVSENGEDVSLLHALAHEEAVATVRIYCHTHSMHLLEPREGDLVKIFGMPCDTGEAKPWYTMTEYRVVTEEDDYLGVYEIIQRNSRPFHWPLIGDKMTEKRKYYDNLGDAYVAYRQGVEVWVVSVEDWTDLDQAEPIWGEPFLFEGLSGDIAEDWDDTFVDSMKTEYEYTRFYRVEEEDV